MKQIDERNSEIAHALLHDTPPLLNVSFLAAVHNANLPKLLASGGCLSHPAREHSSGAVSAVVNCTTTVVQILRSTEEGDVTFKEMFQWPLAKCRWIEASSRSWNM
eukprot:scaffold147026_cov30-Tisochrysis_lutea.AAC.1